MLRSVTLGIAMSVLAAACALVEPPPPPGTAMTVAQVTNSDPFEVELAVTTPSGVLPGAVQPSRLPARGTDDVTFYLPIAGEWTITVNGTAMFFREDIHPIGGCPTPLQMDVSTGGAGGVGCSTTP